MEKLENLLAVACWTILAVSICCLDSNNPAPFILAAAASGGILAGHAPEFREERE